MAPDTSVASDAASHTAPHQALYRRWRAQTFGQVVAQDAVIETLRNAVRLGRLSHGLLFVGPRGTGKTSTARIVAKAVNCINAIDGEPDDECISCVAIREGRALDVVELDAASNNRVDDMRELLPRVYTTTADLKRKVFIIDEVQRIKEGWDVLLKTLEEPPPDVLFIFCTTDPSGIRPAVVSRLQRFTFRPLPEGQILGKLRRICEGEGRSVTDEALELIAQRAAGGMRDAESMLDQVISSGVESIDADTVRDLLGLADSESVERFVTALAGGDPLAGIRLLDELERDGRDLVAFADQVVARLREQLIEALGQGNRAADMSARLARAARRLAGLDTNRGAAGGYRLQLELCLLDSTPAPAPASAAAVEAAPPPVASAAARPEPRQLTKPAPVRPAPAVEPEPPAPAAPEPPAPAKPAPTAVMPPTAAAPPPPAGDGLAAVLAAWPQVVERIGQNPANKPLIAACRPVEVSGATIVLGFPEDKAFLRDVAERKRSALESEIGHVLGRAVAIRCVASNVELAAPSAQQLPAAGEDLVAQARRVFEDDLLDVAEVD